jgi:hypothetical protein
MAASEVSICNLALQKLGARRITALTEDSNNARQVNACYATLRDKELRANPWNFAIKRATLTPLATAPLFDYLYAFPIPADCLRVYRPNRSSLDWRRETQDDQQVILTNDGDSINIRYAARIVDPNLYDVCFVEALASKIAWHCCEQITQSNEKKATAAADYKAAIADAKKTDAFEDMAEDAPPSSWETARFDGDDSEMNWLRG